MEVTRLDLFENIVISSSVLSGVNEKKKLNINVHCSVLGMCIAFLYNDNSLQGFFKCASHEIIS